MEVSEVVEGGDPVFLTITVDRGRGQADRPDYDGSSHCRHPSG